jgi:sugar lactone lactonase YvrE
MGGDGGRAPRARVVLSLLLACALLPSSAAAAPDCPERSESRALVENAGTLESVIVDPRGPLYFTNERSLLRLDRPGAEPQVVAEIEEPGGLAFDTAGNVIVGFGNTLSNGAVGDATGPSGLMKVDPMTGQAEVYATGLSMANGLVRGPDGAFYASNDGGFNIDRVVDGETERGWARVQSGNGLAIDSGGRWLYVAQTFKPAAIQQVDLRDPSSVTPYVEAAAEDASAGLDGMDRDSADRLFVTANGAGEVWRVAGAPPEICVVLSGMPGFPDGPSAIAVGKAGTPFAPANLYVVAFNGALTEIVGAAAIPREAGGGPKGRQGRGHGPERGEERREERGGGGATQSALALRLRVTPRRTRAGRRTRLRIVVELFADNGWQPAAGARVRVGRRTVRTGRRGVVRVTRRFRRPGRVRLRAEFRGLRSRVVVIRVRRR